MANNATPNRNMTYTEVRDQILVNAAHLFPTVVNEFRQHCCTQILTPARIFSVITIEASANTFNRYQHLPNNISGDGIQASLTYEALTERKTAITAKPCDSRIQAVVELLRATEKALAVVSDHSVPWTVKRVERASRRGEYEVDATLLMRNGACPIGPIVSENSQSGESGYDSEIDIHEGLLEDRDF